MTEIRPGDHLDCSLSCNEEEKLQHVLLFNSKFMLDGSGSFLPVLFFCFFIIDFHGNSGWHTERKIMLPFVLFCFFVD